MKKIKPIHIAYAIVIGLVALAFYRFGGNAKAAESAPAFCNTYWYALMLRADGKNRIEAYTAIRKAVPALYDYKQLGLVMPDDSLIWQISNNSVESVYHMYTLERVKEIVIGRPEIRRACTGTLASNGK